MRWHLLLRFTGVVQGVGFRPLVYRVASSMGLRGYVRNNGSNVEVVLDCEWEKGDEFVEKLKADLVPLARIDHVEFMDDNGDGLPDEGFEIKYSTKGALHSDLPPDTPMCDDCAKELFDPDASRYLYPFINCTNCGARYSLITGVPYDRERTSMDPFSPCEQCTSEYEDPLDRRFHAQTLSCPDDGPRMELFVGRELQPTDDPIAAFAKLILEGKVGVVKTWGGMHIVSTLDALPRLREQYHRPAKPFAIMVRDLNVARHYAHIGKDSILADPRRPIAILRSKAPLDLISPGLDNVGMFLPYSPIQNLMFHHLPANLDALVMTSANPSGEPMAIDHEAAFSLDLDMVLLHNRKIVQRVDDTVGVEYRDMNEKVHNILIRKSRGQVPDAMSIPEPMLEGSRSVVAFGPERNVSGCVLFSGRFYTTQYIGNTRNVRVLQFLEDALDHLRGLTNPEPPEIVALDMHPGYATRRLAQDLAKEWGSDLVEVQHHHAHAVSLQADAWQNPNGPQDKLFDGQFAVVDIDGTGYGTDGQIWGGEVMLVEHDGYVRPVHLQYVPIPGGDAAVMDPRRFVLSIRHQLELDYDGVPPEEKDIITKLIPKAVKTSSMGRLFDALAFETGLCTKRTYDGEPAMRLEPLLNKHLEKGWEPTDQGANEHGEVEFLPAYAEMLKAGDLRGQAAKLALDTVSRLTNVACDHASNGLVGLTGGVALNRAVMRAFELTVRKRGMEPVFHSRLPAGDGGISAGQALIATRHR